MGFLLSWFSQVAAVTWLNLRNLRQRLASSAATVVGVAGVVLVVVGVLSVALGLAATLSSTGDPSSVMVMRSGADSEMTSLLSNEHTKIIADAPGILRAASGTAASAELFVIVDVPKRSTGTDANVPLRGVEPAAFAVRESFEIVEGRRFETGRNEVIVGAGALAEFAGLDVDSELRWGNSTWRVVGVFSTGGTVEDTEIWTDARVLQPAYQRGSSFQSVHLRLESPDRFDELEKALNADPRLNIKVVLKSDYWSGQSAAMIGLIKFLGVLIGGLMGFGAVFGALNTMYAAVSSRTREIATLRALGFNASPVVISVLFESLLLALAGGLLGAGLAYVCFNGFRAATLNFQTFSQVAFAFQVTPALLAGGIAYALVMGLVGGFFPAIRAARMPVATALREL